MSTFGANPAGTYTAASSIGAGTYIAGGTFGASAGTLDSVSIYAKRFNSSFKLGRMAVYQGGSSISDPTGATLIFDSGQVEISADDDFQWRTYNAASQSLAANTLTWIAVRGDSSWSFKDADGGQFVDLVSSQYTWATSNPATAFDATVPANSLHDTDVFAAYLTFTVAAPGSSIAAISRFYAMMRQ